MNDFFWNINRSITQLAELVENVLGTQKHQAGASIRPSFTLRLPGSQDRSFGIRVTYVSPFTVQHPDSSESGSHLFSPFTLRRTQGDSLVKHVYQGDRHPKRAAT